MEFRLAIIPAGVAGSAKGAAALVAAIRRGPQGQPPAAIVEVLGALEGSPVGHYIAECRTGSTGALVEAELPESGLLEALLILAKDHDLAVYDIRLKRLYDPTDSVDVDVSLPGVRLPFLTRELLSDLVMRPAWPDPEAPYLTVDRAEQDFIQAWLGADGVYQVEYREGGPESHFEFATDAAQQVVDVMWAWAIRDESWRTALDWQFVDIEGARTSDEESVLRVDRSLPPRLTFSDTGGDPIVAYHPDQGGWLLHVQHYAPFPIGITDFDAVDEAVAQAERSLSIPLPAAHKLYSKSVSLQNEHREDGSWLNIDAQLETDGALRIMGQDFGPVTRMVSDDGEYEWGYSVDPGDVPALFVVLGGLPGEDIIDVLERRWSGDNVSGLGPAIRASGVPYGFWSYP